VGKKRKKQGIQPVIKRKINELYDFSLQNKNLTAFLWENGVKAKQQKKSPAGNDLLFSGVLFLWESWSKLKYQKENPCPPHGLARNFATKVPADNSL